jgi:hypothetical protein
MPKNPTRTPARTKRTIAAVSTTAMAAGMAQGAIFYTNQNVVCTLPNSPHTQTQFDVNGDTTYDYFLSFDGVSNPANFRKPYLEGYGTGPIPNTAVLAQFHINDVTNSSYGLPVTSFGTAINSSYLEPAHWVDGFGGVHSRAYFAQDGNGKTVGDWSLSAKTEGYVGVEFYDAGNSVTNFAWLHLIFDPTATVATVTLVDSGYESTPGLGIVAGATNTVGKPIIYTQPASQTVPVGVNVQLNVVALAAPAPAYQWKAGRIGSGVFTNLSDGGVISGSTTSNLTINGASAANMLDYIVVLTNNLGAVTSSPPATLTVVPPTVTPTPQVLFGGLTAQFNVSVAGGLNPTYHWRKNGSNLSEGGRISGSGTAHLQVGNLQAGDAASYDVVLTLGSLSVTSSVATLAVLPAAGESPYQVALLSQGPWAYYPLNETGNPSTNNLMAFDNAGAFNGTYGTNVANGFNAVAGPRPSDGFPGFAVNNSAASFSPFVNQVDCWIPVAPWKLNTDTATMVAWVNPADAQPSLSAVLFSGNDSAVAAGIQYYYQLNSTTSARDVGYVWQDLTSSCFFFDTQLSPPIAQWSMVATVVTPRAGTVYLFTTNGVNSATNDGTTTFLGFNPFTNQVMAFATPEYIGTDPGDTSGARNFYGAVDEVAVFKKALSQDQLQTIFNGALGILPPQPVTLQIARVGANIQLSWPQGTLLEATRVTGPWATNSLAVSPYTVPPTNSAKFYRVQVH